MPVQTEEPAADFLEGISRGVRPRPRKKKKDRRRRSRRSGTAGEAPAERANESS